MYCAASAQLLTCLESADTASRHAWHVTANVVVIDVDQSSVPTVNVLKSAIKLTQGGAWVAACSEL
jgi:hypothetical protein